MRRFTSSPMAPRTFLDLAVLALPQRQGEPAVGSLHAIEFGLDRPVLDAVHLDALAQPVERRLVDAAMGAHAVAPEPAGRRQGEHAGKAAVIGEQQKAFGVDVEAADGDHPRQVLRQAVEDGRATFRVAGRGHEAAGL